MPGIVGVMGHPDALAGGVLVEAMVNSMASESFYVVGNCSAPELSIYAGWVALNGSFASFQPLVNHDRSVILLMAGECHRGSGDWGSETGMFQSGLIELYESVGDVFVESLNGLFSGLLIDRRRSRWLLFNDRYGVEKLYIHESPEALYFASESKALLRVLPHLRAFDDEGLAQFLAGGCTMGRKTLFRGVERLPGGSLWIFENGRREKRRYFLPETWENQDRLSPEVFQVRFQETLSRVVPRYFKSESSIAIALTGGLDTRMLLACRPKPLENVMAYTFAGNNRFLLDALVAEHIAKACGIDHRVIRIGTDFFRDFASELDRTVYATDGCLGLLGAHELYLNAQTRDFAPVRLTGNYGSELFRGVSTFKPHSLSQELLSLDLRGAVKREKEALIGLEGNPITFAAFREIPWKRHGIQCAGQSQVRFRTPYMDNELVALAYQAPEGYWKSGSPALQLIADCDPPLARIPTDKGIVGVQDIWERFRKVHRRATFKLDYYYNEGLPHGFGRLETLLRKVGFQMRLLGLHKFLHYRSWLQRQLAGYVRDRLDEIGQHESPIWNQAFILRLGDDHSIGRRNYVREINAVLTLEAVERLMFQGMPIGTSDVKARGPAVNR